MIHFLFPALVLLALLWILCVYMDEREEERKAFPPQAQEVSEPLKPQDKCVTLNSKTSYSSLKRQPKIGDSETPPLHKKKHHEDHPHDHTEHHPDMPDALRPRRVILGRPNEEDEEEPPVKKSMAIQTDEEEEQPIIVMTPKASVGTSCDLEMENDTTQTDLPAPRASVGVQTDPEREDIGIQTEPPVARSPSLSESEEESESFESYPLKPKYLSSPSQSEEEESELSSNARRERYSIIQPFMPSRQSSEKEEE